MTRRYRNEVTTLALYRRLVRAARKATAPITTQELRALAGLDKDPRGALGALWMLEALEVIHATRGRGNQYVWHAGKRTGPRPPTFQSLEPFKRMCGRLRELGTTEVATAALIRHAGLDERKSHDQAMALGALKTLAAVRLVSHGKFNSQAVVWSWRGAKHARPFKEFIDFVPLDAPTFNADGEQVATLAELLSDGAELRRDSRGRWKSVELDSSDW